METCLTNESLQKSKQISSHVAFLVADVPLEKKSSSSFPQHPSKGMLSLRRLFHRYRVQILATYILFNIENLVQLAVPLVLGWAVTGLLRASFQPLAILIGLHGLLAGIGTLRRMYDTRTFSRMYSAMASDLVQSHRNNTIDTSRVAARVGLSREFIDFFERDLQMAVATGYTIMGSLIMLACLEPFCGLLCLAIAVPASYLNFRFTRESMRINARLIDACEREVELIDQGDIVEIVGHFEGMAGHRIQLSDRESLNFLAIHALVLLMIAACLYRTCTVCQLGAGEITAVLKYAWMFAGSLDTIPIVAQQIGRLNDISRRIHGT